MSPERFTLDTNILIYAVDRSAGEKHRIAAEVVDRSLDCWCVLTLQALAEFVCAVTRKDLVPMPEAVAQARNWLTAFPIVVADARALDLAYSAAQARRFGLFDALLLATARIAGCSLVLSESMHDGGTFDGVAIRNPLVEGGMPQDLRRVMGMD